MKTAGSEAVRLSLIAVFCLGAAGCGGGSTTGAVMSAASATLPSFSGDAEGLVQTGVSYTGTARTVTVEADLAGGADAGSFDETMTLSNAGDGSGDLILSLRSGGQPATFRLRKTATSGLYTDAANNLVAQTVVAGDAGVMLTVEQDTISQLASFQVFGNETSAPTRLTGRAYYIGPSTFIAVSDSPSDPRGIINGGSGGFAFDVDFGSNSVDGRIALEDSASGTQFGFTFETAALTDSGIRTTMRSDGLAAIGLSEVSAATLAAQLYGQNAGEVAGTFSADFVGNGVPTFLTGALIGPRQSTSASNALANGQPLTLGNGERITLGSGSVVGGSGSVYPNGGSSYYNSNTGVSFGADGNGCFYTPDWSNC